MWEILLDYYYDYYDFRYLMRHTRKVHSKVGGKSGMYGFDEYSCDLCDKSFNAEQYLKLHKIHKHSVAGDINDNNRCRLCNQGLPIFTGFFLSIFYLK